MVEHTMSSVLPLERVGSDLYMYTCEQETDHRLPCTHQKQKVVSGMLTPRDEIGCGFFITVP
jgi:hypothetical protein